MCMYICMIGACNNSVFRLFDMKFGLYRGLIVSLSQSPDHTGACETDGPC